MASKGSKSGSTTGSNAPAAPRAARAPSPASQRKSAAIATYTKQTGSAPPKGWTTAKIEGRARTLSYTGVAGTGYTTPRDGRAASPNPADAYRQKFGHAPPSGMSTGAMERWVASPMTKAPAPPGAYGPIGSAADRTGSGNAHLHAQTVKTLNKISQVPSQPPRSSNSTAWAAKKALLKPESIDAYYKVVDLKKAGDRAGAAAVLRDLRAEQGRQFGPTGKAIMKAANSTAATVAAGASRLAVGYTYMQSIEAGYMFDGVRGAVGTALSKASFGMTDKAFEAVAGKPDAGKAIDRAIGMRSPGLAGMDRRKAVVEARPTRKMREGIDSTNGVKSPAIPATRAENSRLVNGIAGTLLSMPLAGLAVTVNSVALQKASGVAMKGLALVAPSAAKIGARLLPGIGLGVMAVSAGVAAVSAMRRGDSAGHVMKSAALGAVGLPTQGRLSADQSKQFTEANSKFKADAGSKPEGGNGWVNGRGFADPKINAIAQEARRQKLGTQ